MSFKYTPITLKKMEQLLHEADYTCRYERGNFQSGSCLLEEKRVVVVNKFLNIEGRINALLELVPTLNIATERLSTEMLKWYEELQQNPHLQKATPAAVQTKIEL